MSFEMMDLDEAHSPEETSQVHAHRVKNTQSKLPAFRFADIQRRNPLPVPSDIRRDSAASYHINTTQPTTKGDHNPSPLSSSRTASGYSNASTTIVHPLATDSGPGTRSLSSLTGGPGSAARAETCNAAPAGPHTASSPHILQENRRPRAKRASASYSNNGLETKSGPPPALSSLLSTKLELSQKPPEQSTSEWAQQQQQLLAPRYLKNNESTKPERGQLSNRPSTGGSRIPPIRKSTSSSTRSSLGMGSRGSYGYRYESPEDEDMDDDRDQTLRALQGYPTPQRPTAASRRSSVADRNEETTEKRTSLSGTGDLFLDLALEDLEHQNSAEKGAKRNSATKRVSRIALPTNRSSLPNPTPSTAPNAMNRSVDRDSVPSPYARGTNEHSPVEPQPNERFACDKAAAHSRATSIPQTQADINKSRYPPSANRSNPITPRVFNYRDAGLESTSSATSRRDSTPSVAGSSRAHAYKQSNLASFSTPRMYNFSSPSIPRSAELGQSDDGTISTTAPSTVWDELDDLKSRIRKLELTGRLPPTSGQSIRPSGERPPTATTTATTMSTSPKRGRQISGAYSEDMGQGEYNHEEAHPLLHTALAKAKTILNADIYKALENAAQDALTVASMVGSDGRNGYISSGQSVVGGPGGSIADRQLRRKADSMCRSLTELCIALSDSPQSPPGTATGRPTSRGKELAMQMQAASELKRSETSAGIMGRAKASPSRALSRLEARRNSLLRDTPQTSPRFEPGASLSATPGQPSASALAGRRTSLLLGRGRGGTEDPEDNQMDDAQDFRGPSRAHTEIGVSRGEKRAERIRIPPRERTPAYSSLMTDREREREQERIEKERERERPVSTVSNLPIRRTYGHLGSATNSPSVMANRRRYLDRERGTPERDTSSVMERLALDRGNLSRLQNSEAVGLNRTRSLAGGTGAVSRLRARSNVLGKGQNNDSNDTINSTRAEAGAYTRSFGL